MAVLQSRGKVTCSGSGCAKGSEKRLDTGGPGPARPRRASSQKGGQIYGA
jgi:hypothetical protein